jgi:predicted NBD/HSP70 family sugar kinase
VKGGLKRVDKSSLKLASSETARVINRNILLDLIRTHQPVSRAELARLSGLQRSTVSQIAEQLMKEHWICEGAAARLPRGRRPTMLSLNDNLAVLAADIHPTQAIVAIVDLNGRLLSRSTVPLSTDPARSVASIVDCMRRIRDENRAKSVQGIGVSVPGRVDSKSERLIFAPNLGWPSFDIKGTIEQRMGLPTVMENAANSCLAAEMWFGRMEGVRDAVLITVSEGIGAGVLANGALMTGTNGMAGEFGHISLDPSGPRCACTQHGCWETFASCNAALRYYKEFTQGKSRPTFHDLLLLAEAGDSNADRALAKQASYIGRGLRMVTAALSPELILVAGDVTSAWQRFASIIEKELHHSALIRTAPRLQATHDGDVARLRGAAVLLLQRHFIHE